MNSKVYITNRGPHDYSGAKRFGELIFCTEGSLDKMDTAQMYRLLVDAMHDSEPEDYILIGSLTSLCCVATSIFAAKHWRINLLLHRQDGYQERTIMLNNIR